MPIWVRSSSDKALPILGLITSASTHALKPLSPSSDLNLQSKI
ncbi:hypothetical protein NEOC65_000525 [Neochlamydia sp. AcF65]|nr:hypothetical protein [Neochlamydia sp. AcF65]MBS4169789.1 hypothetical protein [Neochlamydia sp. AcF95]